MNPESRIAKTSWKRKDDKKEGDEEVLQEITICIRPL